jgi:hypothetical protein
MYPQSSPVKNNIQREELTVLGVTMVFCTAGIGGSQLDFSKNYCGTDDQVSHSATFSIK